MKGFFSMFATSAKELKSLRSGILVGLLVALSMIIERFTIPLPFAKVNFAFVAISAVGMLFGPTVALLAGGLCDIVGYLAYPDGAFLPLYILIGMLQGLIYGLCLYQKCNAHSIVLVRRKDGKQTDLTLVLRITLARLLDVCMINICLNTTANYHYGFLSDASLGAAILARVSKNILELPIDLMLLYAVMPAILLAYRRTRTSVAGVQQ